MQAYEQLEHRWAEFNQLEPAGMVACSSGTAALHLALEAMELPKGSEVIVPDFTMVACPRAVTLAGLTPVFVDCGDDLLADPVLLQQTIENRHPYVRAVMLVHVYGRRCETFPLASSNSPSLRVVEDLAEAHGVRPHPLTDAVCWSFYRNKIVAGEEGGAVWFRDPSHAALARQLRSLGFTDAHDFDHVPRGHNYRMSNMHADWIMTAEHDGQGWNSGALDQYAKNIHLRREQEGLLDAACPPEWRMPPRQAPWVYDLHIRGMTSEQQTQVVRALNEVGIEARYAFKPMSWQKEYERCRHVSNALSSKAGVASRGIIYLPLTPGRPRIDRVVFNMIQRELDRKVQYC